MTAHWRSTCAMLEESHLSFRVLPTDLDVNMHLTNSRYFSFMDLSRVDHMIRNGAWKHIRARKLMPVLGPSGFGDQFRLLPALMSPPVWWAVTRNGSTWNIRFKPVKPSMPWPSLKPPS